MPKPTPQAEAAAREALANGGIGNTSRVPARTFPGRMTNLAAARTNLNASPANQITGAASPAPAPAPATPQPAALDASPPVAPAAATVVTSAPPAAVNARATNIVTTTVPPPNRPATQATPVVPGAPQTPAPGQRNVAGAPQPGGANTAPAPGVAAGAAPAAAKSKDDEIFPAGLIKFQEADMTQVLEIYQELTGRTVLKPSSLPATKITIRTQTELTRAEAVQALDSILSMNGITMTPQGTKFVKAVAEAQAGQAAQAFNDLPAELLPDSGTYITHVIRLTNASPNDILPVLTPFAKAPNSILTIPSTSMLVLRDYSENVKRMLEVIAKVDVVPVQEFESVVIPIKYALAGEIAQVLSTLTAGGGSATTVGGQRSNTGLSTGGGFGGGGGGFGGGGFGGGFGGQGGFGQPGYNSGGYNRLQVGTTPLGGGAAGRGSFQNRLQQIVNRAGSGAGGASDIFVLGSTKIIADERINALLIFANKTDLVTISNIIEKLDVVLAQVVIEAVVIEVSLNNSLDYGLNYVQTKPTTVGDFIGAGTIRSIPFLNANNIIGSGSNAIGNGFSYAASFMGFDAAITALAGKGRGKILQRPRIQTSHAVEAHLFVGQSRPYPSSSGNSAFGGAYNQIQQLQIGVTLSVLPLINNDGLVVMDIRQKVESYDGDVVIQNVGAVPITSQKEANAKVSVRDRETVILGGFISNQKTKTQGGVPILKDIPILGALFRSNKESDERKELIVLIRPTVLPTPVDAATFAAEERAKLPGTRRAEDEFDKSEKKLLDEENRRQEKENRKLYKKEGFSK